MEKVTENSETIGRLLEKISPDVRSLVISTIGKALHLIVSKGDKSLEKTSKQFIEKSGIEVYVDKDSENELELFKKNNKGIIILSHSSGNFSDYLPLFSKLGDAILKKSIFYTGVFNLKMNNSEFPDYNFVAGTLDDKSQVKDMIKNLEKNIKKIREEGGFIFIIPSGENLDENGEFKGIFQRIVSNSNEKLPISINKVEHNWNGGYKDIGLGLLKLGFGKRKLTKLSSVNGIIGDFKGKEGDEMREYYNSLFKK